MIIDKHTDDNDNQQVNSQWIRLFNAILKSFYWLFDEVVNAMSSVMSLI